MKLTVRDLCNVLMGEDKTKGAYVYIPASLNGQENKKRDVTVTIKTVISLQEHEKMMDVIEGVWVLVNVQEKKAPEGGDPCKPKS